MATLQGYILGIFIANKSCHPDRVQKTHRFSIRKEWNFLSLERKKSYIEMRQMCFSEKNLIPTNSLYHSCETQKELFI
jgi:hypothetical protein